MNCPRCQGCMNDNYGEPYCINCGWYDCSKAAQERLASAALFNNLRRGPTKRGTDG